MRTRRGRPAVDLSTDPGLYSARPGIGIRTSLPVSRGGGVAAGGCGGGAGGGGAGYGAAAAGVVGVRRGALVGNDCVTFRPRVTAYQDPDTYRLFMEGAKRPTAASRRSSARSLRSSAPLSADAKAVGRSLRFAPLTSGLPRVCPFWGSGVLTRIARRDNGFGRGSLLFRPAV